MGKDSACLPGLSEEGIGMTDTFKNFESPAGAKL
jgi:hypothetical protein